MNKETGLLQPFDGRGGKALSDYRFCLPRQRHHKSAMQELCDGHLVLALPSVENKAGKYGYRASLFVQKSLSNKKSMRLYCPSWLRYPCTSLSNIYRLASIVADYLEVVSWL